MDLLAIIINEKRGGPSMIKKMLYAFGVLPALVFSLHAVCLAEDISNVASSMKDAMDYLDKAANATTLDDAKQNADKAVQSANDAEEAGGDTDAARLASDAADLAGKASAADNLKDAQDYARRAKDVAQNSYDAAQADR